MQIHSKMLWNSVNFHLFNAKTGETKKKKQSRKTNMTTFSRQHIAVGVWIVWMELDNICWVCVCVYSRVEKKFLN